MSRSGNVRVAFRLKPPVSFDEERHRRDEEDDDQDCIDFDADRKRVVFHNPDGAHPFALDKVFDDGTDQDTIFKDTILSLVGDFVAGRNCCVLVYGERKSGKSYTLMGPANSTPTLFGRGNEEEDEDDDPDQDDEDDDLKSGVSSLGSAGVSRNPAANNNNNSGDDTPQKRPPTQVMLSTHQTNTLLHSSKNRDRTTTRTKKTKRVSLRGDAAGLCPRLAQEIFSVFRRKRKGNRTEEPVLYCSFVEVYLEQVFDLLNTQDAGEPLTIKSDRDRGVMVEGAINLECRHQDDVLDALEDALTHRNSSRQDHDSSRSHSVVIFKTERYSRSRGKRVASHFFLVDLANSALVRKPPVDASDQAIRESRSIKRSLGALRKCLRSLALTNSSSSSSSFGESILTKLLRDSLGKGSGVYMVVTAHAWARNLAESISAVKFGSYIAGIMGTEDNNHESKQPPPTTRKNGGGEPLVSSSSHRRLRDPLGSSGHKAKPRKERDESSSTGRQSRTSAGHLSNSDLNEDLKRSESTYEELETAGELLRRLPDEGSAADVMAARITAGGQKRVLDGRDLNQVSSLLESAAKRMESDLSLAQQELKASGFEQSMSAEEMEHQLLAVTQELEKMKYDGHLASQIQSDLATAQEELKRLSSGVTENRRDSSNNSGGDEVARLKREIQALRKENSSLSEKHSRSEKELAATRKQLKDLQGDADDGAYNDPFNFNNTDNTNRTSTTSNTTEADGSGVSNMVVRNYQVSFVADKEEDPWDEPEIDVGPSPVRVCLRLRPMTKLERNRRSRSCIEVHEGARNFTVDSPLDGEYDFCFDHVFDVDSSQMELYEEVGGSIVANLLGGVNCAVMVYGLTGTGKSHTMAGKLPDSKDEISTDSSDDETANSAATQSADGAGIAPRIIADLFRGMKESYQTIEHRISCCYVCIYLEKMFDLLDPRFDKHLVVRDATNGVYVEGAVEASCFNEEDVIHLFRRGAACRKLIGSKLKIDHNRSHTILIMNIEQRHVRTGCVRRSYLQLAELAGFEVSSKAKGQGVQETKIIHKSFSALGNVIKSLTEGNQYAPYRESKLTSVLKDALGGNCKTTLFITASPSSYNISETINSIRLGQRVRRVSNNPMINKDGSIDDYRKWLLQTETKLGELASYVKEFAKELSSANENDGRVSKAFSRSIWETIEAMADEEESLANPCRRSLLLEEDESGAVNTEKPRWRALSIALAKRMPSDKLADAIQARDRAESLLTDIQSESVVLRRQNELLVQEKRKKEDELGAAHRENRKISLQNSELEHKLTLAENRAKEAVIFLQYMRSLCWKLRKDVEKDRPIDILEITSSLQGAPDLSGLVDLDTLMAEAGFLHRSDMDIDRVETEFFDYLQEAGLIIDEAKAAEDEEIDELAGLEDGVTSDSRWRSRTDATNNARPRVRVDPLPWSDQTISTDSTPHQDAMLFGVPVPWLRKEVPAPKSYVPVQEKSFRATRREREVQRDLQDMANKCVDLQLELNQQRQLVESLTNKAGTLKMKKLSQEAIHLAKERDRMMHNAKAATWKLQELHVVNKLLSKQAQESKQKVKFLEEGFQRLQESFRGTVQDGLDADAQLRDRVKTLQSIVDSLTGPPADEEDDSVFSVGDHRLDEDGEGSDDDGSIRFALHARIHLPIRGRTKPKEFEMGIRYIDPSDGMLSPRRSLMLKHRGKRLRQRPAACVHHGAKFIRKSRSTGTALMGRTRARLNRAHELGKALLLPLFLDDEEDDEDDDDDEDSISDVDEYR